LPGISIILPAVIDLSFSKFVQPASIADAVMTAYGTFASRALPLFLFGLEQPVDTAAPKVLQVFDHAHAIVCSVSLIEAGKVVAGENGTFVAVFDLFFQQQKASFLQECALLVSWPATGTIGHSYLLVFYVMSESQVAGA